MVMSKQDDYLEYIRDMASPADGPDLTDEELAEVLEEMSRDQRKRLWIERLKTALAILFLFSLYIIPLITIFYSE